MTQNKSHAVMSQRSEPHDSLDDFPTPPWAARALCEHVISPDTIEYCWEPACNRGYLAKGLSDYFKDVICTDIHDYGWDGQHETFDFLFPLAAERYSSGFQCNWIITNPPFRLAEQFIQTVLDIGYCRVGCAVLVRTQFLEGVGRFNRLFSENPPNVIAQFCERVPMVKGRIDSTVSTATSYAWLIWFPFDNSLDRRTDFIWIPPCRKQLERDGDYE